MKNLKEKYTHDTTSVFKSTQIKSIDIKYFHAERFTECVKHRRHVAYTIKMCTCTSVLKHTTLLGQSCGIKGSPLSEVLRIRIL